MVGNLGNYKEKGRLPQHHGTLNAHTALQVG